MKSLIGKRARYKYFGRPTNHIIGIGSDYVVLKLPISSTAFKVDVAEFFECYDVIE